MLHRTIYIEIYLLKKDFGIYHTCKYGLYIATGPRCLNLNYKESQLYLQNIEVPGYLVAKIIILEVKLK